MSNLLISKKGKIPSGLLTAGAIFIGVGVFILVSGLAESSWRDSDFEEFIKAALPFLCIIGGGAMLASAQGTFGKTYINLYNDKVEGLGMCNGKTQIFFFTQAQGYRIMKQGSKICVFCNGVGFDIPMSEADATAVYDCFMRGTPNTGGGSVGGSGTNGGSSGAGSGSGQTSTDTDKVIVACTHCGAKCRVPKGKGSVVIKCPRCAKEFHANT